MSLTSFILEFREYYSVNSLTQEIGDPLIGAQAKQAVRRISKLHPRANQRVSVSIVDGDTFVLLPVNFQSASLAELYRLKTGILLTDPQYINIALNIWGDYSYSISSGGKFTPEGRVRVRAIDATQETIQIFETDAGRFALWLDTDSAAARTVTNFQYTTIHQLTDDVLAGDPPAIVTAAIDSIGSGLRDVLLDETMNLALSEKGRQLLIAAKGDAGKVAAAKIFLDEAKKHGGALRTIAPIGGAA